MTGVQTCALPILYTSWHKSIIEKQGMTKKRKKLLKDTRTFSSSVQLEFFELTMILPTGIYKEINRIRRIRNNAIHDLEKVSLANSQAALKLSRLLLVNLLTNVLKDMDLNSNIERILNQYYSL